MDSPFPVFAKLPWIIGIFALLLGAAYVTLVRWLKLGRVAWKRMDYVWMGVALLGLVGVTADVRRLIAANLEAQTLVYAEASYQDALRDARYLAGSSICRTFTRSEYSPEDFDDIQREFSAVCEFGKLLVARLPQKPLENPEDFSEPRRPVVNNGQLRDFLSFFDLSWGDYVAARQRLKEAREAAKATDLELTLFALSPLLLATALALRFTKTMAEIRLERGREEDPREQDENA